MTVSRSNQPHKLETVFRCLTVVFLLSALVIALVAWILSADISRFLEHGNLTPVEILEFREVSSGSAPETRTFAVALGAEPGNRKIFASHILMDDGEVARLSVGRSLHVVTLPAGSLMFTLPRYDLYFVTPESIERHAKNPPSSWAIPSTVILLTLAAITALASLNPKFWKDGSRGS